MIHSQYSQPHLARSDQNQIQTYRGSESCILYSTTDWCTFHCWLEVCIQLWGYMVTYRPTHVPRAQKSKKTKVPAWYHISTTWSINSKIFYNEKAMFICYLSNYTWFINQNIFGKWPNVLHVMNSRRVDRTKLAMSISLLYFRCRCTFICWCWCLHSNNSAVRVQLLRYGKRWYFSSQPL